MEEVNKAEQIKRELNEIYRSMIRQNQASFFGHTKTEVHLADDEWPAKTNLKPLVRAEEKAINDYELSMVEAA